MGGRDFINVIGQAADDHRHRARLDSDDSSQAFGDQVLD